MSRHAALLVLALAFSSSSFALVNEGNESAVSSDQSKVVAEPAGNPQANCLYPSRVGLQKTNWVLPVQEQRLIEQARHATTAI